MLVNWKIPEFTSCILSIDQRNSLSSSIATINDYQSFQSALNSFSESENVFELLCICYCVRCLIVVHSEKLDKPESYPADVITICGVLRTSKEIWCCTALLAL